MKPILPTATACLGIACLVTAPLAMAGENVAFNIPAQPLADALLEFSQSSGTKVFFSSDMARDIQSRGLNGRFTPEQGLQKLLAGTQLVAQNAGTGAITLAKAEVEARPSHSDYTQTSDVSLPKVTVTGKAETEADDTQHLGYKVEKSYGATKTNTAILDTPQAVQVVPRDVIDDRVALTSLAAVKNISGVQSSPGTFYDQFQIRGFDSGYGVTFRNGLQLEGVIGATDSAFTDRIEVVKGPGSMLYGRIEPGGFVNVVTRKPLPVAAYSLQQQFGSYGMFRTTADATGPLTSDGSLSYRLIGVNDMANTWVDYAGHDNQAISGAINYRPNNRFELNLNVEYYDKQFSDGNFFGSVPFIGAHPAKLPRNFTFGGPSDRDIPQEITRPLIGFDWTYQFNDSWKINHRFHYMNQNEIQTSVGNWGFDDTTGDMTRGFAYNQIERDVYGTNLNLSGEFNTGLFKHKLLAGGDWFDYADNWMGYLGADPRIPTFNIFKPEYPNITGLIRSLAYESRNNTVWTVDEEDHGVYLQDQISLYDRWHLLLGGRYDWASVTYANTYGGSWEACYPNCTGDGTNTKHDDAFSPRAGLLYKLTDFASLYFSYSRSFGINNGVSESGEKFDPEMGEQYEVGAKAEFFQGRLTTTATYFDLTKQNVLTAHPFLQGVSIAVGEINSRGVELDVSGQLTDNISLIGSYTYDEAIITKNNDGNQGNRYRGVAPHAASLWAKYDSNPGEKNGWVLGSGYYVLDEREGDNENFKKLPGYVRIDAMAAYRFKLGKAPLALQFNVQNLFNEQYIEATDNGTNAYPGAPRLFIGSIKVDL